MSVISVNTSEDIDKKISMLTRGYHIDRLTMIQNLIDIGVQQKMIEYALEQYGKKKVSLGKAAEIAGVSIREMLDILNEKDITLHISKKSVLSDFEAAVQ